jgi:hydroxymethylpyrimidine pyrophosphatase-like HAD family hydrolase
MAMRFHVLATDYDGTIARDGRVEDDTIAALERVRKSGRKLILVTGRQLPDLVAVFPRIDLFDCAVIENGAVIFNPTTRQSRMLAGPPPSAFAEELLARGVRPVSSGDVIVATCEPHQDQVLSLIHEFGLELQVIFNKGAVMVLPSGVNKATGLSTALEELGLSPHNTLGIGDAENDHAFLRMCECSVAVANALPALKDTADLVTRNEHGAGVVELIDLLLGDDLLHLETISRHRIPIGDCVERNSRDQSTEVTLDPAGPGVLIAGTSGSGKSTVTTAILEQLVHARYQVVVMDPEGDHRNLEFATHVGTSTQSPAPKDVTEALRNSGRSVVVNLLGVELADRPQFFAELVPGILAEKAGTGRPHWLVIDDAHHLLPRGRKSAALGALLPERGLMFVTVHVRLMEPMALANIETLVVIGQHPLDTLAEFCVAVHEELPDSRAITGDMLAAGRALLWRRGEPVALFVRTRSPITERKQHSRKYAEGNLGHDGSFYFRGPDAKLNLRASNLSLFLQIADGVDDETWNFHVKAGDFSNWVRTEIRDHALADELEVIENKPTVKAAETRQAVRTAIESHYTLPAEPTSNDES